MTVRVTPWKPEKYEGRFEVDIRFDKPDGSPVRSKKVVRVRTETQARRWGEARESQMRAGLLDVPAEVEEARVLTVAAFGPTFIEGHLKANLAKASAVDAVESILRLHVYPHIGRLTLDAVTDDVMARLRATWLRGDDGRKGTSSAKTLNNRLSVVLSMLKTAIAWKRSTGLAALPCAIRLLTVDSQAEPDFLEHADYEGLVEGARRCDPKIYTMVLLAGDAGLRRGEIIGLDLADIDFARGRMTIRRNVYLRNKVRHVAETKGGKAKPVPLTMRLAEALRSVRHLRGPRLLYTDEGAELTPKIVRRWVERAERRAGKPATGRLHVLRHTFASHAAMAGVPVRTIQELARHASLNVTMRYMHLSPSAIDEGIEMLTRSREAGGRVVPAKTSGGLT